MTCAERSAVCGPSRSIRPGGIPLAALITWALLGGAAAPVAAQTPSSLEVDARVEIPAGSDVKYEVDVVTGELRVDRFVSMPVNYPGNYGFIPGTSGGDGDPLDVLVLTRSPLVPGALIRVRPVGVLRMVDGGEEDAKLIAVPVESVDPHYAGVQSLSDLPQVEVARIEAFFRVYKDLPPGRKVVELHGFGDREEAAAMLRAALRAGSSGADR